MKKYRNFWLSLVFSYGPANNDEGKKNLGNKNRNRARFIGRLTVYSRIFSGRCCDFQAISQGSTWNAKFPFDVSLRPASWDESQCLLHRVFCPITFLNFFLFFNYKTTHAYTKHWFLLELCFREFQVRIFSFSFIDLISYIGWRRGLILLIGCFCE